MEEITCNEVEYKNINAPRMALGSSDPANHARDGKLWINRGQIKMANT